MSEADAQSPARRVYYALQCAYMFEDERPRYQQMAQELLNQYSSAAPSSADIITKIQTEIGAGRLYNALRASHSLIEHETERFKSLGLWPGLEEDSDFQEEDQQA